MGFLDNLKGFVQKNILDKTSIDEKIGGAFNTARSNLSSFGNQAIKQPTLNFAQNKVIDPVSKLKNRVTGFINKNTIFADPTSNNGDNFWGENGRGQNLAQERQRLGSAGSTKSEVFRAGINASPIGMFNKGGFFDDTTRGFMANKGNLDTIVQNRDTINKIIDSKPKAKFIGQNVVKPLANAGISILDRTSQMANKFSDAYQDLRFNTDGNRNPVANTAKILTAGAGAYTLPKVLIADLLNAYAPTDFTKGLTSGFGDVVSMTDLQGNNGKNAMSGNIGNIAGNILGWRQNFFNKIIGNQFDKNLPYQSWQMLKNPVANYFATRGIRGATEQIPYSLSEMSNKDNGSKNSLNFLKNEAIGAGSEIVADKLFDVAGKGLNRVMNGAKPQIDEATKRASKFFGNQYVKINDIFDKSKYPNLTKEQIAKVKLLENPKTPGKGLFPSEVENVKAWAEQARKAKRESQGGFINFGVIDDALKGKSSGVKESVDNVQKLVDYGRQRGYQDSQIFKMLRNKGYDTTGTNLKNQPSTIESIFKNRKKDFSETLKPTADEIEPKKFTKMEAPDTTVSDRNAQLLLDDILKKPKIEEPKIKLDQKAEEFDVLPRNKPTPEGMELTYEKVPKKTQTPIFEQTSTQKKKLDEILTAGNGGKPGSPQKEKVQLDENQIKEQEGKLKTLLTGWAGKVKQGQTLATKNSRQFEKIPSKLRDEIITAREGTNKNPSPEGQKYAGEFGKAFDKLYAIAKKYGVDVDFKEDYFTHIWDDSSIEKMAKDGVMGRSVSGRPYFTKNQKITWQEGLDKGLTPRYQTVQEMFEDYSNRLYKSIANKQLVSDMKKGGIAQDTQVGYQYKPVSVSGYYNPVDGSNTVYLPEKMANMLQKVFNPKQAEAFWEKGLEKTAKVGRGLTQTILSGGYRSFNAMGLGKLLFKEIPSGNFNAVRRFGQSMTKGGEEKIYKDVIDDVLRYQKWGINIGVGKQKVSDYISNKNLQRSGWNKVKKVFADNMESPTFDYFIPATQVDFARSIEKQARKQGMSEEQIKQVVSKALKNKYDIGTSLDSMLKNKNLNNLLDTVFFAKTLRKSTIMSNGVNNIKALGNPLALENRGNVKGMIGTVIGLATLNAINKASTGNNMWENPDGWNYAYIKYGENEKGEAKYFRLNTTSIEYTWLNQLSKLAGGAIKGDGDQVASTAKQTLQFGTKSLVDLVTNTDWKMDKIWEGDDSAGEKAGKIGKYVINQNIHPVAKAVKGFFEKPDDEQRVEKLVGDFGEIPGTFKTEKNYKTSTYYKTQKDTLAKLSPEDRAIYEKMQQKATGFDEKNRDKVAEAYDMLNHPEVMKATRDIAIETAKKNGQALDPLWKLSDDQLKTYYQIQGLANNATAQKELKNKATWYSSLTTARGAYFDELVAKGQMKAESSGYPEADAKLQATIDQYYKLPKGTGARTAFVSSHPELKEYWNKVGEYKDKVAKSFGIEQDSSKSSYGSGGSNGWSKYYDQKDKFALRNKLNNGFKPKTSKNSSLNGILKIIEQSNKSTKSIRDILAKNSKNFDKKITYKP